MNKVETFAFTQYVNFYIILSIKGVYLEVFKSQTLSHSSREIVQIHLLPQKEREMFGLKMSTPVMVVLIPQSSGKPWINIEWNNSRLYLTFLVFNIGRI